MNQSLNIFSFLQTVIFLSDEIENPVCKPHIETSRICIIITRFQTCALELPFNFSFKLPGKLFLPCANLDATPSDVVRNCHNPFHMYTRLSNNVN